MIEKREIETFIEKQLEGTDAFLVDVKVSKDNDISVEIDADTPVDLDFCIDLSKKFEETFSRDVEDYSLEIGSAGLTSPFKVARQWEKNVGNEVELLLKDGRKLTATLDAADAETFTISYTRKVKKEGEKRPVAETFSETIPYADVKKANLHLVF